MESKVEFFASEIIEVIKKSKQKFIDINYVSEFLKESMGENYSSELSIAVKDALKNHDKIDFFREGDYYNDSKYYYCVGNWFAIKGTYKNPIEAKNKMGWASWQKSADDDGSWLD